MTLRRAVDKTEVEECQAQAMELLNSIQMAYRDFHAESVKHAATHPVKVVAELVELQRKLLEMLSLQPRATYDKMLYALKHPEVLLVGEAAPAPAVAVAEGKGGKRRAAPPQAGLRKALRA
eukprot:1662426-Prymnesium_polylepis.1